MATSADKSEDVPKPHMLNNVLANQDSQVQLFSHAETLICHLTDFAKNWNLGERHEVEPKLSLTLRRYPSNVVLPSLTKKGKPG